MQQQIFQTNSSSRWQRYKWSTRILFLTLPLALLLIILALTTEKLPDIPELKSYKQALAGPPNFLSKNSLLARKYKGYRQYFTQKQLQAGKHAYRQPLAGSNQPVSIRSAFYVTWNADSYTSLQRNISKLNLVIPEWLFIDPKADTLYSTVDARGLALMKQAGISIMPMLSNFYDKDKTFHGDAVHRILSDSRKRAHLIGQVVTFLQQYHCTGINIDLEELRETSDEGLVSFQKEIYERLHAKGFLVSQDVIPFNDDYNTEALSRYNDYLFLMAYDEYAPGTKAGPVAEQKWIEAAVDNTLRKLPAGKLVLGLAAYGYDWPDNSKEPGDVSVLTYKEALALAKEAQARIDYNNDTYNLHFSYYDDDNAIHQAYFTDAATTFNAMRFAQESGMAGVALWRLGSEDERIWSFYNKSMAKDSVKNFDFGTFAQLRTPDNVSYSGFGEILDVLVTPHKGMIRPEIDSSEWLISEENYDSLPASFIARKFGWNGADTIRNKKKLVLTFDDGPDPTWTPKILDVLASRKVPASFFVVGMNAENHIPLVKRIYQEGHEIGDHTFTHPNIADVSHKRAIIEMETTRLLIECITGHSTVLFRAPYNADFTPEKKEELLPVAIARTKNYLDVGESIDPLDWEPGVSADSIFQRVVQRKQQIDADERKATGGNIILLHDAGGDSRKATLEALPRIIDYYQKRGYTFTTIADLLGKKKEDLMPPVPKGSGYYLIEANYMMAVAGYYLSHILFALFLAFILLSIGRLVLMALLTRKQLGLEKRTGALLPTFSAYPLVSVIVPAYNEEVNAVASLHNLLKTDYPHFEILFIDDGSKDATFAKVAAAFQDHPAVQVFTKPNGGKASALNFGIGKAQGDYVVCIDADTQLLPDAISHLMKHFLADAEGRIGAVAGNVKVGNEVNMLTRWQAIEYITSQNFDRRAFAAVNAITVVPGAIGAFRKQALIEAGLFTTDTLAEDCDLTIRLLKEGYRVQNENKAIAMTEAPEKLNQFLKQRFRWNFGVLQTLWKHRDMVFNPSYKWLGCLALPNILLFQYCIPAFIPLADLFMLTGLLTGNSATLLPYYAAFLLFDAGISVIAFRLEKESLGRLVWIFPQRLLYRWILWWVLFKSVRKAIKGELQGWGALKRTGRVKLITEAPLQQSGV
ncbi:MAG TPA: glycosyltransferase [Flavisolibacter sp.]|jgi:cellulose synthase/poly-beta-1,6-N-acetylglucosamine synthase-like glycosyltransferase/spore germination protein YaaH/peptidoglycan/xylan/chitin deacetylase (PgdA/CDA1 family)|nr:glycosyltransferase [Flavisolibacter sp.]